MSRPLLAIDGGQLGISAGVKTASGQSSDWLGSGATDVYALLRFSGQQLAGAVKGAVAMELDRYLNRLGAMT